MDAPPPRCRQRKRGFQKIGRGSKGRNSKRHRAGVLISPSRSRRGGGGDQNGAEAAGQRQCPSGGACGRGPCSAEVKQLNRKLSIALRKVHEHSDEVCSLKKANSKLEGRLKEEVEASKVRDKRHQKEVASLQSNLHAAEDRLKDRERLLPSPGYSSSACG